MPQATLSSLWCGKLGGGQQVARAPAAAPKQPAAKRAKPSPPPARASRPASSFVPCPVCQRHVPAVAADAHVEQCLLRGAAAPPLAAPPPDSEHDENTQQEQGVRGAGQQGRLEPGQPTVVGEGLRSDPPPEAGAAGGGGAVPQSESKPPLPAATETAGRPINALAKMMIRHAHGKPAFLSA